MQVRTSECRPFLVESAPGPSQFRGMSRLAFSGWTLLSLCLWAGLIETVRLLF